MKRQEVTIPTVEYEELLQAWYYREAMIATGVDEWMGYDVALEVKDELRQENFYARE